MQFVARSQGKDNQVRVLLWLLTPFGVMVSPYGAWRSHSLDTLLSVGLLWTCDQPDAETSTSTIYNTHKRQTSVLSGGKTSSVMGLIAYFLVGRKIATKLGIT
jgi:hypothetical protein